MKYFITLLFVFFTLNACALGRFESPPSPTNMQPQNIAFLSAQLTNNNYIEPQNESPQSCEVSVSKAIISHEIEYGEHTHKSSFLGINMDYIGLAKDVVSIVFLGIK
ncbi:MAG: hypothetical protein HQ470_00685 [Methylophilales bacterium]|nr:hypothetical protein [Methylophilales bacterium]